MTKMHLATTSRLRRRTPKRNHKNRLQFEPLEARLVLAASAQISEFMAVNDSTIDDEDGDYPDWIEISNPTGSAIDLSGWYLTDDSGDLNKWQFPDNVTIQPDEFLVVFASDKDRAVSGSQLHTNFKLASLGESVLLVESDGTTIVHGYENYPQQFADLSYGIGVESDTLRLVSSGDDVSYLVPTAADAAGVPVEGVSEGWTATDFDDSSWTDSVTLREPSLVITEVFTGEVDWIEIQNVSAQTQDTTGYQVLLNDSSSGINTVNTVNSTSWSLPAAVTAGEVLYRSDDAADNYLGADIDWDNDDGWAMIVDAAGNVVDFLAWGYSTAEIGTINFDFGPLTNLSPAGNWTGPGTTANNANNSIEVDLMQFTDVWSYDQSGIDLGTAWRSPSFDDSAWPSGAGLLYVENSALPAPRSTPLIIGRTTYYFRSNFNLDVDPQSVAQLNLTTIVDDGAIVYINGIEALRIGMNAGAVSYSTFASRTVSNAAIEGPFTISPDLLVPGNNVITVEVHQTNSGSSDIVWGAGLTASVVVPLVERTGSTDNNTSADFSNTLSDSKGTQNPTLVRPFQSVNAATTLGLGFSDDDAQFDANISTDTGLVMEGVNASLWSRIEFDVADASVLEDLTLRIKYDDGFIAYLNGTEIARRNADNPLAFDTTASAARPNGSATTFEDINIAEHLGLLSDGTNVLAIAGLNQSAADDDFLLLPELIARGDLTPRHFNVPTPGAVNSGATTELVAFSQSSGTFTNSFLLTLSASLPSSTIRYTTNRTLPNASSPIYSAPLNITTTTQIRTLVFDSTGAPGPVASETYIQLAANVLAASSDLPMVIVETWGSGVGTSEVTNFMAFFEPNVDGRTSLNSQMTLGSRGRIHVRGSSSANLPKKQFRLEFWDEADADKDLSVLGMPKGADWILYAPQGFDRSLIANPFIYDLSNQIGRYAVRTRWVEVYMNTGGGAVSQADYVGLYAFMENIKRGEDRVDVEQLSDGTDGPVEGGWIRKIDRGSPYVYPRPDDINTAQRAFTDGYINQFQNALNSASFTDPDIGYAAYLDVPAAIDHNWLNMIMMNVDAFRLSGYMFKTQEGKLEYGPIWDFDRSLESTDGRDDNPRSWRGGGDATNFFTYGWWNRFFQDPNFWQAYIDRWQDLREQEFSTENINATIDTMADEIREAADRDYARWSGARSSSGYNSGQLNGTFQGEINHAKNWLDARMTWIDSRFLARPTLSSGGGMVDPNFPLTISTSLGSIYYTTDGSDPRSPGGGISPTASLYTGAITIDESTQIRTRTRQTGAFRDGSFGGISWSGITDTTFFTDMPSLRITEIMFNPANPSPAELAAGFDDSDNFEFIELENIGTETLDLNQFQFTAGIDFDFSTGNVPTLAPGSRVVVINNLSAFQMRYGTQINIAGQFANTTQLANNGERIQLQGALGQVIHNFSFNDTWYPITDGDGYSLTAVDSLAELTQWETSAGWRPSENLGGSPGTDDGGVIPGSVLINEVLSNGDGSDGDWIELLNVTNDPLDIGYWYLSDDEVDSQKYRFPAGTMIPALGLLVVTQTADFANINSSASLTPFQLNELGGSVYLRSGDDLGVVTSYLTSVSFGAAEPGVSFGRYQTTDGIDFTALQSTTLATANDLPTFGPLIINEIMYNPLLGGVEFIELYNTTESEIVLNDGAGNAWSFTNGIQYTFPVAATLSAGGYAVLIEGTDAGDAATEAAAFRTANNVPASAGIYVYTPAANGLLDNSGEKLELSRPGSQVDAQVATDWVRYNDRAPWPTRPDGDGASLARIDAAAYTNDPTTWGTGNTGGTPGRLNLLEDLTPPTTPTNLTGRLGSGNFAELAWAASTDLETGVDLYRVYRDNQLIGTTPIPRFTDTSDLGGQSASYEVSAVNADGSESARNDTPFEIGAQTISFQQGVAGYSSASDSEIREGLPTSNNGLTDQALEVDGDDSGTDLSVLLQWDNLSIPAGATVAAASITIGAFDEGDQYNFYQVLRDWEEGQVTWSQAKTGQPWQTAGVRGTTDRGAQVGTFNGQTGFNSTELNVDGIAMVQAWIDDGLTSNFGVLLSDPGSSTNGVDFRSREYFVATERPQLNISYFIATDVPIPGDLDLNDVVDSADVDLMRAALAAGVQDTTFDLNEDGSVNADDLTHLVVEFLGTAAGDANLDLRVDRTDVVSLLSNFARPGQSGWTESDFSGDLKTGLADLALLQPNLGFVASSPQAPASLSVEASESAVVPSDDLRSERSRTSTRRSRSTSPRQIARAIDHLHSQSTSLTTSITQVRTNRIRRSHRTAAINRDLRSILEQPLRPF